ncbi:Cuticle protein 6 [Temnothorax longispinosus]|uniref:Cuticle protein 6 n=1 Tax=Temnothorax longispinosus TaxID=300112 RepID=A0A4S2LBG6_9HYME|nr:Cuticle protein 6 [Temnothorax longispinosus]
MHPSWLGNPPRHNDRAVLCATLTVDVLGHSRADTGPRGKKAHRPMDTLDGEANAAKPDSEDRDLEGATRRDQFSCRDGPQRGDSSRISRDSTREEEEDAQEGNIIATHRRAWWHRDCLFLVFCLIATGFAKPPPPVPVFLSYQDSLGQYSFGYSAPGSARSEVRTSNGATRGTYSYVDGTGVIQTAQYVADGENGFRVIATNLPQAPLPVQDTPEVMAARTAHLQALELAAKRDEEAQNREENRENAREKKIEGNQGDASPSTRLSATEITEIPLNEGERKALENTKNIELKDSDETLQAVASTSGTGKASEMSTQKEFAGRVSQEIIGGANIPAIPLISSHVSLSQALGQHAVPVFRISYGNYEIEPSIIPESSIAEGAFRDVITPAATALKSTTAISTEGAATPERKESSQRTTEQIRTVNTLPLAPLLGAIPLGSSQPSIIRYVPSTPLQYVAYNVLMLSDNTTE